MTAIERSDGVERLLAKDFEVETSPRQSLREALPWAFPVPTSDVFVARGRIDDAEAMIVDYASTLAGSSSADGRGGGGGGSSTSLHAVVILRHPRIAGCAVFYPEPRAWSRFARALDIVGWIPPFVALRGLAWVLGTLAGFESAEDRLVGHAEFDRLFRVHAGSDEIAAASIPGPLCEFMVRAKWPAIIEIRDGELRYSIARTTFDGAFVDALLRHAPELLSACVDGRGPAMR